jgi:hypothetical protein
VLHRETLLYINDGMRMYAINYDQVRVWLLALMWCRGICGAGEEEVESHVAIFAVLA